MKIAIIGATGFIGSALLNETLSRGHQVTALVTHPEKLTAQPNLEPVRTDVLATDNLVEQLKGHDAVISAFSGHAQKNTFDYYVTGVRSIITAVRKAGVPRFLIVGGAGSLEVAPGLQLLDTPEFPAEYKATAEGAREALNLLKNETEINWTMLSPSAIVAPGKRTGNFRLGSDQLLVDAKGESHISLEDFSMAMINELEKPMHQSQRFTVGY